MIHSQRAFADPPSSGTRLAAFDERWPGLRRRAAGVGLALLLELGLLLLLLTLGQSVAGRRDVADTLTTVDLAEEPPPAETPPEPDAAQAVPSALPRPRPEPQPVLPTPPVPMPPPPAVISSRTEPAPAAEAPKIRAVVRDQDAGPAGPPNRPRAGDSQRVGTAANGQPLYAARWYREPYPEELRGYLSTAGGPGWALINCRTVKDFRVEDCELVDEYPGGSQMGRAVLAAAWQFKVRPPQVGGRVLVGSWVRIRITYDLDRG
jgi:periplasmic protein TonB